MNPHTVFCPNPDCPARGRVGAGNIHIHARTPPRYRCTVCNTTFSPRVGTLFHRRSTDEATIIRVLTLLAHGCPPAAIEAAFGVQRQTVRAWQDAAGVQSAAVHQHLVCQPRDLGAVQADEIRVRQQGGIVWVALAMMVTTRLWLGGAVSPRRDGTLIRPAVCADQGMRAARAARGVRRRLRGVCQTGAADGALAGAASGEAGTVSAGRVARLGNRTGGQAARSRSGGRGDAPSRTRYAPLGEAVAGGRNDPDGIHRAAERDVPRTVGESGAADAGIGPDSGAIGSGDVAGGNGLQLLHTASQSGAGTDARDGGGDHGSCLGHGRTAALPGTSRALARTDEMGEADESGGGGDCALGSMTTVPHPPTE